ncbi:hypothetical protein J6590_026006 [Homalodisca vitripennis]|nr:hypothetical protein J6590_026006 [Homalodisca vitripennis]
MLENLQLLLYKHMTIWNCTDQDHSTRVVCFPSPSPLTLWHDVLVTSHISTLASPRGYVINSHSPVEES